MNTSQNNPEIATGNEVGGIKTVNSGYTSDCRLAGRLAEEVAKVAGAAFSKYNDCYIPVQFSPDGVTIKKNGMKVPFTEEVVEIPTPPWTSRQHDETGMGHHYPGWRVYKSEMMSIILGWVESVIAEPSKHAPEHVECGPLDETV